MCVSRHSHCHYHRSDGNKDVSETDYALGWYWGGISSHIDVMVHCIYVTLCEAATNIGAPEVGELPGCKKSGWYPRFYMIYSSAYNSHWNFLMNWNFEKYESYDYVDFWVLVFPSNLTRYWLGDFSVLVFPCNQTRYWLGDFWVLVFTCNLTRYWLRYFWVLVFPCNLTRYWLGDFWVLVFPCNPTRYWLGDF